MPESQPTSERGFCTAHPVPPPPARAQSRPQDEISPSGTPAPLQCSFSAGFHPFPISRSVKTFQLRPGSHWGFPILVPLYRMRTFFMLFFMLFFRVMKTASAQTPLQCQDTSWASLCPFQLLISVQIPDDKELLPYGFIALFHTMHRLKIQFRGKGVNNNKYSRMP